MKVYNKDAIQTMDFSTILIEFTSKAAQNYAQLSVPAKATTE